MTVLAAVEIKDSLTSVDVNNSCIPTVINTSLYLYGYNCQPQLVQLCLTVFYPSLGIFCTPTNKGDDLSLRTVFKLTAFNIL